jgi:lipoate-protein ligase A
MRWQEKIPNGKLVCMEVWASGGIVERAKITGDFFLHPEETIVALENSLKGLRLEADDIEVEERLSRALGRSELIGVSVSDFSRIFRKAVSCGE